MEDAAFEIEGVHGTPYCLRCKKKVDATLDVLTRNKGRYMLRGTHGNTGHKVSTTISAAEGERYLKKGSKRIAMPGSSKKGSKKSRTGSKAHCPYVDGARIEFTEDDEYRERLLGYQRQGKAKKSRKNNQSHRSAKSLKGRNSNKRGKKRY